MSPTHIRRRMHAGVSRDRSTSIQSSRSRFVNMASVLLLSSIAFFLAVESRGHGTAGLNSRPALVKQFPKNIERSDVPTGSKKLAFSTSSVDCYSKPQSELPFCDPKLPFMERAKDLESRLTLAEKIQQTSTIAPAIERFGIKDYNWRSNCLHGWTASGGHWVDGLMWTVFPAPIGLGATFDPDLILKVAQATADEGRALHNEMLDANDGSSTEAAGVNCFSPNVNILRDPRWGRGQESFGEDPLLVASMGAAYTRGLQVGEDKRYLKIAACAKSYVVHSGPEELRLEFVANVSLHDLYDTYLPAFKTQVVGEKVAQIMPAYSGVRGAYEPDGAPDAANTFLLKTVLREEFNAPDISIVSDNGAVEYAYTKQKYVSSAELAAAVCMNASTDLDLGHDEIYPNYLQKALDNNQVQLETIRDAVVRSFYLRMRVGDFDPPYNNSYNLIDKSHLGTIQNQQLNLQAARKSIVLLKNQRDDGLPIDPRKVTNLAVIGPNANATNTLLSNYEGIPFKIISVLEAIKEEFLGSNVTVNYASGCANVKCENKDGFGEALQIAKSADYVIMVMGLDQTVEAEGRDRVHVPCDGAAYDILEPPGCQNSLVRQVSELNRNIIVVLINGGPLSLSQIYPNRAVIGIIEAFYPGAQGGTAIADVLLGKYSPGGRMPVTTYVSSGEIPPSVDYGMSTHPGRTYRYYRNTPLIPFGYGLSYASFFYRNMTVTPLRITACESITVAVGIENFEFSMEADEVVQVYLVPPKFSDKPFVPNIQLVGFKRVTMTPSQKLIVTFDINPYHQSLVDEDGKHYIFPGVYMLYCSQQPGGDNEFSILKGNFTITGDSPVETRTCTSSPQCLACN